MNQVKTALTIAGTDPSGGAGIQADLKTFQEREVYGMSVITSVVAQNTTGVEAIEHLPIDFIEKQLHSIFSDIYPDALKSGMIATIEMMELLADTLKDKRIPFVIDPVMVAKSGDTLMEEKSRRVIRESLVPLATVVTPNIPETEILVDFKVESYESMKKAAKVIVHELGSKAVVIKGGHLNGAATDVLYDGKEFFDFTAERTNTKHTHGTGCTFSAAITAELAKGKTMEEAVGISKQFITDAIQYSLELGKGNGPTNHWGYRLKGVPSYEKGE
ncbi:bifunctional hydroxymethylpyrimidine kinase/phosphomethylpyrimidine kinase [Saliterribacillus persicus]|uniref:Hydroxymethylpyrimidine/phosphomethylpyrimidine kinase n=1 Tax=Saliterribacillus persicus TaxID=930114 RepID=A0A368XYM2_9BACI|nr:bifunctional hydroxymethylpyrimidine kinase/phosphomethylpyrimidine kinase [Saliterribacillus persicus]RCW73101.1 hydroxymethylpyrimidine/phosphomethylpyrimidine kinase [Saliterribacillus persicus]